MDTTVWVLLAYMWVWGDVGVHNPPISSTYDGCVSEHHHLVVQYLTPRNEQAWCAQYRLYHGHAYLLQNVSIPPR